MPAALLLKRMRTYRTWEYPAPAYQMALYILIETRHDSLSQELLLLGKPGPSPSLVGALTVVPNGTLPRH